MHPNLLEQLRTFRLIAETGSFSRAARELGRAVSAVSYTIATLEEQLGLTLFDRGQRRPVLTSEGRTLLQDAEIILRRTALLDSRVRAMRDGENTDFSLVVETSFPDGLLASGLARFSALHPYVSIAVTRTSAKSVEARVAGGEAALGIVLMDAGLQNNRIDGTQIAADSIAPVASPSHPLARLNRPARTEDLDSHRQIHLHDGPLDRRDFDYRVHGTDLWLVDNLGEQAAFVKSGIGWAFMPRGAVHSALAAGGMVVIDWEDMRVPPLRRYAAIWRREHAPGEIGMSLVHRLAEAAGNP